MDSSKVTIVDHPLVQHKLTLMRRQDTSTAKFRNLTREISMLLGYEVTRNMPMTRAAITTPVGPMEAPTIAGKKMALVPILRAGMGILDGMLQLMPTARVGHVGLYRDVNANAVVEYYFKMPHDIAERRVLVLDPMLATGHSAVAAVSRLKTATQQGIDFVSLLAAPEGLSYFHTYHPDVQVFTASVDECLNDKKYIVPGLGDAGDRLFGTQ